MTRKTASSDWVQHAAQPGRIERIEAYFGGHGYSPHRHDTYAIGLTLAGVQSFQYRRAQRHSLPGTVMVLHPDELHDGEAGTAAGFHYRMAYIEPSLIQQILGGRPLPFIEGGLSVDSRIQAALTPLLQGVATRIDLMEEDDALHDLAHALLGAAGERPIRRRPDFVALERARAHIHDSLDSAITIDALAESSGLDRWQLSRDFRALYGTSPYRYLTMRRLDVVRRLMLAGQSINQSALMAGFFDQSHMARHFISTYGAPPAQWLKRMRISP
ncbi:AraC family transcriptional regulator|uniref:AraC family transcriptional regulator n=1 Tax=Stenotrophomonas TaxID=40323 RepID=UPI0015D40673|nr:AraC family transcriptional regulator [Stenotrophomonas sp. SbOxS2]MBN5048871.1 AraC family transcriptional regulator [Stenotrophomonas maltophilia]NYU00151.1 AraC family transcriptional regulator [Stenotrophomonas sp. SbOxS2]